MKKTTVLFMAALLCFAMTGCGKSQTAQPSGSPAAQESTAAQKAEGSTITDKKVKKMDAAALTEQLQAKDLPIGGVQTYDKNSDPNGKLGKEGEYISKTSFSDTRLSAGEGQKAEGGTIEVFKTAEDAQKRRDYISEVAGDSILMQEYMYLFDTILLRVSNQLSLEEAQDYATAMQELTGVSPDTQSTVDLKQAMDDFMQEVEKSISGE